MEFRKFLVKIGILDLKIGDKVKPNPKIFKPSYQLVYGQEYGIIGLYDGRIIKIQGSEIPYTRLELVLY